MEEQRYPIAAARFYEFDKEQLIKQIEQCFVSKFGPGKLPQKSKRKIGEKKKKNKKKKKIVSAIVPHAGYVCSGMCAAFVYDELSKINFKPDTIIIIGTDHTGNGSGLSLKDWITPLGVVEVDKEFCKLLVNNSKISINEKAHSDEHSIEVQLPFLQYIYNYINGCDFKVVPITISFDVDHKNIAKSIFEAMKSVQNQDKEQKKNQDKSKNENKNFVVISSGDFTHYGLNYGFVPFEGNKEDIKENLKRLDKKAIEFILKLDSKGFIEYLNKTKATICGRFGFTVLIELNKLLKHKGRLLKYYTSGDVFNDYDNCVSYASLLFL